MRHSQPKSFTNRARVGYYVFTSFVGGFIHNTSLSLLILCFGFATVAAGVATAKSLWYDPGVRSFVAALEAGLSDKDSSANDLNTQPPPHSKDLTKADKGENRARRKLVEELRQKKASASNMNAVQQPGRRILRTSLSVKQE
jgi:hypothetical protein